MSHRHDNPDTLAETSPRSVPAQEEDSKGTSPLYHGAQNHCFGCGTVNPVGLRLNFAVTSDLDVICDTMVSDQYEGPPGFLHGGIIATLLDEAMSKANRALGVTAMTRQMQVEYLRPVPSGTSIRILGRVLRSEGRKHWTEAFIRDQQGQTLASSTGLFIAVNRKS